MRGRQGKGFQKASGRAGREVVGSESRSRTIENQYFRASMGYN